MYNIDEILKLDNFDYYIKTESIPSTQLKLLKYLKKNCPSHKYNTVGRLRSIILDKDNKCIMFSPPKSMPVSTFMTKYSFNECIVEEFIEGTMINLFWDPIVLKWEIATKSVFGAKTKFYQDKKMFSDMFYECLNASKLDINKLDKNITWSFVMQHPDNKIVNVISSPNLFLVECFKISDCGKIIEKVFNFKSKYLNVFKNTTIQFVDENKYTEYKSYADFAYLFTENEYISAGVVIKSPTGERCKILNPFYEYVHKLHGNASNKLYRYIELIITKKIEEYLIYYPEDTELFKYYYTFFTNTKKEILKMYIDCFIKKTVIFKEIKQEFKPILWNLHNIYKNKKQQYNKYKINLEDIEYVLLNIVSKYVLFNVIQHQQHQQFPLVNTL